MKKLQYKDGLLKKLHYGNLKKPVVYEGNKYIVHKDTMFSAWKVVGESTTTGHIKVICTNCDDDTIYSLRVVSLISAKSNTCKRCACFLRHNNIKLSEKYSDYTDRVNDYKKIKDTNKPHQLHKIIYEIDYAYKTKHTIVRIGEQRGGYIAMGRSDKKLYLKCKCIVCNNIKDVKIDIYKNYTSMCATCAKKLIFQTECVDTYHLSNIYISPDIFKQIHELHNKEYSNKRIKETLHVSSYVIRRILNKKILTTLPLNIYNKQRVVDIDKIIYVGIDWVIQKGDRFGHWTILDSISTPKNKSCKFQCKCAICNKVVKNISISALLHNRAIQCMCVRKKKVKKTLTAKISYGDNTKNIVYESQKYIVYKDTMFGKWKVVGEVWGSYLVKAICTECKIKKIKLVNIYILIRGSNSCEKCAVTLKNYNKINNIIDVKQQNRILKYVKCKGKGSKCKSVIYDKDDAYKTVQNTIKIGERRGGYIAIGRSDRYQHLKCECIKCKIVKDVSFTAFTKPTQMCSKCFNKYGSNPPRSKKNRRIAIIPNVYKKIRALYLDRPNKVQISKDTGISIGQINRIINDKLLYNIPPNLDVIYKEKRIVDINKLVYIGISWVIQKGDIFNGWEVLDEIKHTLPPKNVQLRCRCVSCGKTIKDVFLNGLIHGKTIGCVECRKKKEFKNAKEKNTSICK